MNESAAARAIRLLDLVPFLLANQGITVDALAKAFSVTRDEIIKDLNLLFVCGLPGYTPLELIDISFEDDFVVVKDPQNLTVPRNFNYSEAIIARIALGALYQLVIEDPSLAKRVKAVKEKLDRTFSNTIPEEAIYVELDRDNIILNVIKKAIANSSSVHIKYANLAKDAISSRAISPESIVVEKDRTLINAFCHQVNARRTFNLNQIIEATLSDQAREIPSDDAQDSQTSEVVLAIRDRESNFYLTHKDLLQPTGANHYRLRVYQTSWIKRIVMSDPAIELLEPEALRVQITSTARGALEGYLRRANG